MTYNTRARADISVADLSGSKLYTGTASSSSWVGSDPYTQVVSVTGLTVEDKTILELDLSQTIYADVAAEELAFSLIYRAVPGTDQITLYATGTPAVSFDINVVVI